MSTDPKDYAEVVDIPTPGRKGKKRVVWSEDESRRESERSSANLSAGPSIGLPIASPGSGDWLLSASSPGYINHSPQASPSLQFTPPGAPDAQELRLALNKVLLTEEEERHFHEQQTSPVLTPMKSGEQPSPVPRMPRPVLRRNTSYNVPQEQEEADKAEKHATERQLRSMTDARQRADRLAVSVGALYSQSAPGSRRNSIELERAFQPVINVSDDHDPDLDDAAITTTSSSSTATLKEPYYPNTHSTTHRTPHSSRLYQPHEEHDRAEMLVNSHAKNHLFHPQFSATSGRSTPVIMQAYAQDYVPRPSSYRGGILSSLLKLYRDDNGADHGPGSSGRPSTVSTVRSRSSSRLRGYHKSRGSTSSVALEKIKKEKFGKPKKEQIRITVHIAGIIARHRYLLKLCRALMMYGAPTHRLEEYMNMSSRVLEIEGQFLYIPSCMIISFDDSSTHTAEVKVVRVPQGVDLGRLRDVHNIYKDVVHDKLGVEEATRRLDEVIDRKPKFKTWFRVFMYGLASVCVAPFAFQGRFIDLPIAFLLGCLVGLLQLVFAPSNELYAHVFEVSAAVITTFIARGFGSIQGGKLFCFSALAQSSIALILPGYMVLCGSLELQSHNIVAGSVRMVHAVIYTLFLGYGITIGASLYGMLDSNAASATTCDNPLSFNRGWNFLFVPGFTLCLCIINQAQWKQTPVMTIMSLAGFCVNSYSSQYFESNSQISNMLGALTIGILANLYSRLGRHVLAAAAMLPAIFVQVPSGLAASGSLNSQIDGTAFTVLLSVIQVAIGISVGLFMSALIVYPLGKRRSGLFSF
ncbi:putative threonine/serine exporter domain-containing protein [Trichoderma breve]|uniref:Threonine/serine exporter domain-containing protein n=1 Tax=Trichoderma breve TaxID=2034170 RepID=A0A9W9E3C0_9HYPO|nr:putative threonine/serine exporter domain-containing protein [Trichoderma breve]KAJ4854947.1 putative threonine/serine exporter domain-containing protein [Trichoderma breve]